MDFKKLLKIFEAAPVAATAKPPAQGAVGSQLAQTSGGQFMNKADRTNQTKVDAALGPGFKAGTAAANMALAAKFKQPANPNQAVVDASNARNQQAVNQQKQAQGQVATAPTMSDRAATDTNVAGVAKAPTANQEPYGGAAAAAMASKSSTPDTQAAAANTQATTPAPAAPYEVDQAATAARDSLQAKANAGQAVSSGPQTVDANQNYGGGYDPSKVQYAAGPAATTPTTTAATPAPAPEPTQSAAVTRPAGGYGRFTEEDKSDDELEEMMRLSGLTLNEKAPPTVKGERMVKHIKKGYAKDGKLTKKEKSIAYATAWKQHNKEKMNEDVMLDEGGNTLNHIKNRFKHEVHQFMNTGHMDGDLYEALYDYYNDMGEMPYGIAKARTGDPYQWVEERFYADMGSDMSESVPQHEALSELARLAGLSESKLSECNDMPDSQQDSMSISTNMDSNGTKNVTISAQGTRADELLAMLKLAGMNSSHTTNQEPEAVLVVSGDEEMMDEETDRVTQFANTPDEEYETVDAIIHQGDDLNREKRQYADKPKLGDNPMAEDIIDEELSKLLDSVLLKRDMDEDASQANNTDLTKPLRFEPPASVLDAEKPYRDEKTGKLITPPKGATMPPPDSEFPPGDKRNMVPRKK